MTVLSISTLTLLMPLYIFIMQEHKNIYEIVLASSLSVNVIVSFLFWLNPVRHSIIHYYDGLFGKITFVMVSGYVLCVKPMFWILRFGFKIILAISLLLFYFSDMFSNNVWCCREHICCHFIFHLSISMGCMFAFI